MDSYVTVLLWQVSLIQRKEVQLVL